MRKAYLTLVRKELRQTLPTTAAFALALAAWLAFVYSRIPHLRFPEMAVGLAMIAAGYLPFWLAWRAFAGLRDEWHGGQIHLLLALPVPRWYLTGAKALVTVVEVAGQGLLVAAGMILVARAAGMWEPVVSALRLVDTADLVRAGGLFLAMALLYAVTVVVLVQSAYLAGRVATRRRAMPSTKATTPSTPQRIERATCACF